jgi:xanthine dehydrogenase accessory factor
MEREKPSFITLDMTDELLGVGMPCGGIMDVYIEPVIPMPELLIVGHGRIAEVVATLGHLMEFRVVVNTLASGSGHFPQADRLIDQDLDLNDTPIGPRTYVVIATLHKSDHLWLQRALESEAAYVALIASRHRAALVLDYLRATGMPAEKVEKVRAPAGLDLGALTPEEIGLSIMSQIVGVRRGGSAVSLGRKAEAEGASAAPENRVIRQCGPE